MPVQTRSMAATAQKKKKITFKPTKALIKQVNDLLPGLDGWCEDYEEMWSEIPHEFILTLDEVRQIADGKKKPMVVRGLQDRGAYILSKDHWMLEDRDDDDEDNCGCYYSDAEIYGDNEYALTGSGADHVLKITPQSLKWLRNYITETLDSVIRERMYVC